MLMFSEESKWFGFGVVKRAIKSWSNFMPFIRNFGSKILVKNAGKALDGRSDLCTD